MTLTRAGLTSCALAVILSALLLRVHPAASESAATTPGAEEGTVTDSTPLPPQVNREDDKVWIEGVPTLGWAKDIECTFAGALEAALAVAEHPYKYSDLMGFTGLAFRTRWLVGNEKDKWCPSSPVGEMPEEIEAAAKATGWPLRVDFMDPKDPDGVARLTRDIVASIDRGRPVLAYEPKLNMDVIFGYEDDGETLLLRDYFQTDEPLKLAPSDLGFLVIFIEDQAEPLPTRDAFIEALEIAVRNWERECFTTGPGEYWYGEAALNDWISDIAAADTFTQDERGQLFFVSHWCFSSLVDARLAAVAFLREHAPLLGGEAEDAVKRAAKLYNSEVEALRTAFRQKDAFLGPWSGKSVADWSSDVRQREQDLLARARDLDAAAIAEIEQALGTAASPRTGDPMQTFTHGFRRDPMRFVEDDPTLQGALVRTFVFSQPHDGDAPLIQKQIDEILSEQRPDGAFGDTSRETGDRLLRLLQLGFPPDRPEVATAVEALLRQKRAGQNADEWYEKDGALSLYALHAFCLLGRSDLPEVTESLRWFVAHPEDWNDPWQGCPWTPEVFWTALWSGRGFADTEPTVNDGLRRVTDAMNAAGCIAYNDPYGFLQAAGQIDTPEARALVHKQIPMILRGQQADGGWGDNSFFVFRALSTHGLLESLRGMPPLPPDWRIVRSIPAPGLNLWSLTWDGESLWVYDREDNSAIAISPEDGQVLSKVKLPVQNVKAIGWWDNSLAVTQTKPKMLLQVDPDSGEVKREIVIDNTDWAWVGAASQVNGKVWVADEFSPCVIVIDPADPDNRERKILAGPAPECFAPTPDGVWHCDFWAPAIIKTSFDGTLLDWGDQVFDRGAAGLAFDGENLWALDGLNRRICIIEKALPREKT